MRRSISELVCGGAKLALLVGAGARTVFVDWLLSGMLVILFVTVTREGFGPLEDM